MGERKYCTNWAKRFLVAKVGPLVVVSMGRAAKRNAQSSIFLLYNTMLWVADRFRKRQESGSCFAPTVFKVQQTSWRNLGRRWSAAGAALFCTSTNGQSESVAIDSHVQMSNLGKMVFAPYKILLWKMSFVLIWQMFPSASRRTGPVLCVLLALFGLFLMEKCVFVYSQMYGSKYQVI